MRIIDMSSTKTARAAHAQSPQTIRLLIDTIASVGTWRQRLRLRRKLSHFGDHLLNDIGLDRHLADEEINKPYWRS